MKKSFQTPLGRKLSWFCLLLFFLSGFPVLFQSCAALNPPPPEEFQVTLLEKQIQEMDKKLDEIYHRVSIIQFMLDNHERKMKDLEKSGVIKSSPIEETPLQEESVSSRNTSEILNEEPLSGQEHAAELPTSAGGASESSSNASPDKMYNSALALYKKGDFDKAASAFISISEQFPNHDLADNSLYWAGECYYSKKNYSAAILSFKKVVTRYPEGSKIPDAFLKTGYAYLSMGDKGNARLFLKKVIENFPFSPAGSKAEEMLKRIR
jgi:tol-pal system protein YbgF